MDKIFEALRVKKGNPKEMVAGGSKRLEPH
jgi:hypothetical protein